VRAGLTVLAKRVSRILRDRPLVSLLITAAALTLTADAVRKVVSGDGHIDVFTWVALALMGYAVIAAVILPKRVDPSVRPFLAWGVGTSPSVYGYAAVLFGSPNLVMWVGVVLSLCLVASLAIAGMPHEAEDSPNGDA
jgi:hypothetical protein